MNRPLERILVVDDDQYIQEIIAAALEDYGGYTVAGCCSGAAALDLAPTFRPDLIMLDMVMPGMDGRMALEALRTISALADTPALFLTAQSMNLVHCMELPGVIGALAKPFHHRTLVTQIQTLWKAHIHARQLVPTTERIAAIRQRYLLTLPQHSEAIRALWAARSYPALKEIAQLVHQLAGSGASLGFASLSTIATRIEAAALDMLATNTQRWQPNKIVDINASEDLDALLTLFYDAVRASSTEAPRWLDAKSSSALENE